MRPRDWFLVGIRLIGVWVFYHAAGDLISAVAWALDLVPKRALDRFDEAGSGAAYYVWYAAGYFALALYLIFGAEGLTKWIFKEYPTEEQSDDEEEQPKAPWGAQ